jgi:hypothetical protein
VLELQRVVGDIDRAALEAFVVARAQTDPAGALALLRAVEVTAPVWLAALFAAGTTLLAAWWWDRARR